MKTMLSDSAHGGAVRTGQPAWRRALAIMLIALLSPVPALLAFWADANSDGQPDSWVDPLSGRVFTLAELDAFSDDIDGDGLSNAQELAIGTDPFVADTDGDGLWDVFDPLPLDSSNSSQANGIDWGAFAMDDADGDGIPNFTDADPYGAGGPAVDPDSDDDGIPDPVDPAPGDPYNISPANGFPWLGDALADADGDGVVNFHDWYPYDVSRWDAVPDGDHDGIPDGSDPNPNDYSNYSFANGISWAADAFGDSDADGIANFYDAYPYDSGNGYVPSEPDADGDGIPDSSDPSPWDYHNFSAANGISWQGDVRGDADNDGISNFYDQFPYDYYNGNVPVFDMDGDGIPDVEDPAPSDPTNLSPVNGGLWYTAALADADGDGNPNFTDPWPYDPTNGNLPPEWDSPSADTDADGIPNAQDPALADPLNFSIYNGTSWYADAIGDLDLDGIVNFQDSYPYDYYNGSYAGPDSDADGVPDSSDPYPNDPNNGNGDADGDGIVDSQDPYPYDATNGSGGTGGGGDPQPEPDTDGDGRPDSQDPYPNDPYDNADFDQDGIPDVSDPAQTDPKNLSPLNGLEWYADVRGDMDSDGVQNFWDLEPFGSPEGDFDGDGLLTFVDPAPVDQSNYSRHNMTSWPSDALGDFDGDGVPNFFDVWPDDSMNGTADADMDGIPDLSDPAPGDPINYSSYNDRNWYGTEALGDLDNDGRLNFFDRYPEDFYDGNPPVTDPDTDGDGLADSIDPAKDDPTNVSPHNELPWPGGSANEDDDGDMISNFDDLEPYPKLPEPGPGSSCMCSWPPRPFLSASRFVLLNDNFDELTGPWTPESKRDFETVTLKAGGEGAPKTEGLMPLAISLPDGYANGQRSIVIRSSGAGEVRIHAVRGNEEDCVYSSGTGFVLKQGDGWQYWVEGTRAGEVKLEYEFPESGEYREAHRPPGCGATDCITLNYDWSSADSSSTAPGTLTIQVVKVEFITPSGDPVKAPVDAGITPANIPDGANEFTYSAAEVGVLTVKLKAKVTGIGSMPADEQAKLTFALDSIGSSTFAWDEANPGGKATVSGDFITATATYTGLPQNNSDFGLKIARLKHGSSNAGEARFEVFFPKDWMNHPGEGSGTVPNWFFYWKDGRVCGIPDTAKYDHNILGHGMALRKENIIKLGRMAPDGNRGPHTLTSTYGTITVTGQGRGIQCVAETVAHELHHLALYSRSGWFPFWQDDDRDDVDNSDEPHLDGIKSDALNADTYNVATATRKPEYSVYGDNEVRCRKIEMTHSIGVYPTLDWANPGCQTFNRFGPKP